MKPSILTRSLSIFTNLQYLKVEHNLQSRSQDAWSTGLANKPLFDKWMEHRGIPEVQCTSSSSHFPFDHL